MFPISRGRAIRATTHLWSPYAETVRIPTTLPLYWRVCLINGAVFIVGTMALALSPATVSAQVLRSEAIVLGIGLTAILVTKRLDAAGRVDAFGSAPPADEQHRPPAPRSPTPSRR